MARPTGVEPVIAGLEGWCIIQLCYGRTGRTLPYLSPMSNVPFEQIVHPMFGLRIVAVLFNIISGLFGSPNAIIPSYDGTGISMTERISRPIPITAFCHTHIICYTVANLLASQGTSFLRHIHGLLWIAPDFLIFGLYCSSQPLCSWVVSENVKYGAFYPYVSSHFPPRG